MIYMKLKDGKSKVLTLSYDDCVVQDIRLIQIMNQHGIKGTFNINSGLYLPEDAVREKYYGRMKLSEARNLYLSSGHEIAAHGFRHTFLGKMKSEHIVSDLIEDRRNIEQQFGVLVRGMAYPYSSYNEEVMSCVEKCGIRYSRVVPYTERLDFPENWLAWHPTCHHNNPKLLAMAENFVQNKPRYLSENWLFYLWGHSYEFDNNDNWNVIEEFCQKVGGRDDVWYATNIEIYDYVTAYEQLQVSVDGCMVYNPSVMDVWFAKDEVTYCVHGGETLVIKNKEN